jgi:Tetratricopeptide repeat
MAGRYLKWPLLVASAGATMALMVATARLIPGGPIRVRPLAIHRAGTPNVVSALVAKAEKALGHDRYAEAERLAREALAIQEKALGPEHPALVSTLRILSGSYSYRDRFVEAEPPARRALAIIERHPGPPHSDRIVMLGRLAFVSARNGDRAKGDEMSRRALALAEDFPGYLGADLFDALTLRGAFLGDIEYRHAEAAVVVERALALLEQQKEPDPYNLSLTLSNLGGQRIFLEQYPEAERLLLRSQAIRDREPGLTARSQLDFLGNLSVFYVVQRRYDEAEPVLRQILATAEASRSLDDPSLVEVFLNLARVLEGRKKFAEVEPLARRALGLAEKVFGAESAQLRKALTESARILRDRGYSDEAVSLLNRSLAIAEKKVDGPDALNVAVILEELAKTHDVRGAPADVVAPLSRAIAIREKVGLEKDTALANNILFLSGRLFTQKKYAEAELLAKRAVSNAEKIGGPDNPALVPCLNLLAGIAQELDHGAEAELLAKRALTLAEKGPAENIEMRMNCLAHLSQLYTRQGQTELAQEVDRRSHALTVEHYAKLGMVEREGVGFVLSPNATQAQKDAWASELPKDSFHPPVGVEAVAARPSRQPPINVIGGEIFGWGWPEFPTDGNASKPTAGPKSPLFPEFPSDIDVKKTSGIDPNPVVSPTPPPTKNQN